MDGRIERAGEHATPDPSVSGSTTPDPKPEDEPTLRSVEAAEAAEQTGDAVVPDGTDGVESAPAPVDSPAVPVDAVQDRRIKPLILGRRRSIVSSAILFSVGAGLAYVLLLAIEELRTVMIMLALAVLIALTLEPLVRLLNRRGVPRWAAALISWLFAVAVMVAPVVLAVRAASTQLPHLINDVPDLIRRAESHLGSLGTKLQSLTSNSGKSGGVSADKVVTYVLTGGQVIFDALADTVVVAALSLWLSIAMPGLTELFYRLVARSRRPRVETITNEVLDQVSKFMLANVLTSILAGVATWAWALGFGIPYALLLGALVAVLDLIPTVGSTIGGIVVSLVALTVGLPVAIATAAFYIAFRLLEDYVIQPRAMRYSVELPGVITVPVVLIGGAVLGIPGALFAVPVALVVRVLVRDIALPAIDRA
ncbi:MAG: AI-2E family transporter [Actinobacteria bacterium]|nr:AI-2E family transporter [Actinomycetota bacterium]